MNPDCKSMYMGQKDDFERVTVLLVNITYL